MKRDAYLVMLFCFFTFLGKAQECKDLIKYSAQMEKARLSIDHGYFDKAMEHYKAASFFCTDSLEIVEKAKEELFNHIDGLREDADLAREDAEYAKQEADNKTREALSNDLAFKAQTTPDRTTAYRLAELSNAISPENSNSLQQLLYVP